MEETTALTAKPINRPSIAQVTGGSVPSVVQGERLSVVTGIPIVERTRNLPLSFAQERLWFLAQMEGGSKAYQGLRGLHLHGELNQAALRQALNQIVARHEALRTVFTLDDGKPVQRIVDRHDSQFRLVEHDLRECHKAAEELDRLINEEANAPLDLETGPLIRGRLVRQTDQDHILLITIHHIVSDAWSFSIFSRELSVLYRAYLKGEADPLPELRVQYADYAIWQRKWLESKGLQEQAEYWKTTLAGAPELLQLPTDHPRPAQQDYAGARVGVVLNEDLTARLRAVGRRHGTTLYMTVLAGWAALLERLSGQEDVVVGTPVANRRRVELEGLIGFFVNTLPLRLHVPDSLSVCQLLSHARSMAVGAQHHQDIPFERMVELARPVRSLSHNPIFQVMFAWQNAPKGAIAFPGLQISPLPRAPHDISKFDLNLSLQQIGNQIIGELEYAVALFEKTTAERFVAYLCMMLNAMTLDDKQEVGGLSILPEGERRQVLHEWNATHVQWPQGRCAHELFEEQARRTPGAVALAFENHALSYAELDRCSNQLARYLRESGVRPDDRVAICAEHGIEMMIGLLGTWKAGGAYVPLDPAYPDERLEYMLADSAPAVLLIEGERGKQLRWTGTVVDMGGEKPEWRKQPGTDVKAEELEITGRHVAYVIYTSGSTGRPKGVMIEHASLVNLAFAQQELFGVRETDHILQFFSFSFDVSLFVIVMTWSVGARLVLAAREELLPGPKLVRLLEREGITLAVLPPVVLAHMEEAELPQLRQVIVGGESWQEELAERWGKGRRFFNSYGPTETTVQATVGEYRKGEGKPTIGRPIRNVQVYVLDQRGEPAPVGVAGEIYIGGDGVGRGYMDGALTAERFVPDEFSGKPGRRLYRTGDWGRWLGDGRIDLVGRTDEQIKIRGYRVELGEIEAVLGEHPKVRQGVVVVQEKPRGEKRLVAYVVAQERQELESGELRGYLKDRLPEHMVPWQFVLLERFPLTESGKINRRELPEVEACGDYGVQEYETPHGKVEETLADIWADLLNVEKVGRRDNFFELGGHSLLVVRVVARVQQLLDVEVGISDLFAQPVLSEFARVVERGVPVELPPIVVSERGEYAPLSFAQQRLWFLAQIDGVSEVYHLSIGWNLKGDINRAALRQALDCIVARHEVLRTVFVLRDGEPVQRTTPAQESSFSLREYDLREQRNARDQLEQLIAQEKSTSFDFERGPLVRGLLIRQAGDEHALLITMHHIVSDGWSMAVFGQELSVLYSAFLRGDASGVPGPALQYADYAIWQRKWIEGDVLLQQAAYWKTALAGAPALLEIPADHPRPAQQDYSGAREVVLLDEGLAIGLRALSRRHGTTLYMTVLAGWAALLARLSGQEDLVIGTPVANRRRVEIEGLIGFFVNTLALRLEVSGTTSVSGLLAGVKAQALAAQQNQDIPFEQVVELAKPVRSLSHNPIFQMMFAWQNTPKEAVSLPGLELRPLPGARHSIAKFDLTLSLQERDNEIAGGLEYATALFNSATVERYLGYFLTLLRAMVLNDTQEIGRLPILPQKERLQVLYGWNATDAEYPQEKCIHELFEEQVLKSPDAVAVTFEDDFLEYAELNRRANQVAHYLRELGVGPDARVGICADRSLEMIVGLLAVLKAGGAYVPLDPSYPTERLQYMVEDSAPVALLTNSSLKELLSGFSRGVPVLDLNASALACEGPPEVDPACTEIGLTPRHLAYVIYTSGSTGTPKGVMVEHRSVVNRLVWMQNAYRLDCDDSILQKTPMSFDVSVWEFFWPLLTGARLVMARPEGHKDPAYLSETISRRSITTLHFVPSMLQAYLDHLDHVNGPISARKLLRVVCSGEALPAGLVQRFQKKFPNVELHNLYGPTEATVDVTAWTCPPGVGPHTTIPIGRPIANTRMYILDGHREPVPPGVTGELYISGVGVARGYWNRPELTEERFLRDRFVAGNDVRMFKTGDLARWLANGTIEFLGRNDFQVKVRGFRIELSEIEARLLEHQAVREVVVIAREDMPGDKRLVAYYASAGQDEKGVGAETLRAHLAARLPDYMVPAAYVWMERLPLTANGKLDRKRLPAPEAAAYVVRSYGPPTGRVEEVLAGIWAELLKVERVGRYDNFFELGGHSLLAVKLVDRMSLAGLHMDIRALFTTPTLADLALTVAPQVHGVVAPPNGIPPGCKAITPAMLPLVQMGQEEIEILASRVPGGTPNIQDIYPLAPLQEGILFHHLMGGKGDPYLLGAQMSFDTQLRLDAYLQAMQAVIDRHDILRTAVMWEGLREPVQVVWRNAVLPVEQVELDPEAGDAAKQLYERYNPRNYRIDVRHAPLLRVCVAHDEVQKRWLLMRLQHHLAVDHSTQEIMREEIEAHLLGKADALPVPLPFRNFVAQARLGVKREEHEAYFKHLLGDVEEPTAPFGLLNVRGDGTGIEEACLQVQEDLARQARAQSRKLGVSVASLFHVTWAVVLAKVSARPDVVFGTLLFGRMQGGAGQDHAMGLFINTLPVRIQVGDRGVEKTVRQTHLQLAELLRHEHASLALAQRCSAVPAPAPLFSALLNYRHNTGAAQARSEEWKRAWEGVQVLSGEERTNYPVTFSVDDLGQDFRLRAQVQSPIEAMRICEYMHTALSSLVQALETTPEKCICSLDMLPETERHQLIYGWNDTTAECSHDKCVHELFEEQADKAPEATAVVWQDVPLSYRELNRRANQLAHHLRELGVAPDARVAILVERGFEMIVGLLAVLKAGGAYVPLDPAYPEERLQYMLADSTPAVLLTQKRPQEMLMSHGETTVVDFMDAKAWCSQPETNLDRTGIGLTSAHPAYVIYTSGSTGSPKGVMVEHHNVVMSTLARKLAYGTPGRFLLLSPISFDSSVAGIFGTLTTGGTLLIAADSDLRDPGRLYDKIQRSQVESLLCVPSLYQQLLEFSVPSGNERRLSRVIVAGEICPPSLISSSAKKEPQAVVFNEYGPTEATVWASMYACSSKSRLGQSVPIGKPIANARIYILDGGEQPVPVGVRGEIYIGGAGVARGYLNRPELTAECFIPDPFVRDGDGGERMYKTGDLGQWLGDGTIEFAGRNDYQVKIRGFRIELGEIEAALATYPGVLEAVVVARNDVGEGARLVAYYTSANGASAEGGEELRAEQLRAYLVGRLPEYMAPAAYMQIESWPRTPSGKLDRKALPAPEDEAYAHAGYEAPQGETETLLAAVWAEVLNLERVGRHDSFFELGGHSLLIQRTVDLLAQKGIKVRTADVFEYSTPKLLADRIESGGDRTPSDRAICIRKGGLESPLFLVHEGTGSFSYARLLSEYLDSDLPVYGLPAQPADEPQFATVEASAARMVQMIRAVRSRGPYRIAGWSFGGLITYETAAQLIAAGDEVEFVGLLDAAYPRQDMKAEAPLVFDDKKILLFAIEALVLGHLAEGTGEEQRREFTGLQSKSAALEFDVLHATAQRMSLLPPAWMDLTSAQVRQILNRSHFFNSAKRMYSAQYIPIPVYLFSAEKKKFATDPFAGWNQFLPENQIRIIPIAGKHNSMMRLPYVKGLGQKLSAAIRNASKERNKGPEVNQCIS